MVAVKEFADRHSLLGQIHPGSLGPGFDFAPIIINPGESAEIPVTITPTGVSGSVVSGNLYVDDFMGALPVTGQLTGNEITAIPYSYTIE